MSKQKITMTIDEKVFNAFKELCKRRAMKVSSKVELMMREFVEQSDDAPIATRARKTSSRSSSRNNSVRRESDDASENAPEQDGQDKREHTTTPGRTDHRDGGDAR